MSYEENCIDFALFGDPEQEHYDHELNAQFDRWDGWGDVDYCGEQADNAPCPDCAPKQMCAACRKAEEEHQRFLAEYEERNKWADDVPF